MEENTTQNMPIINIAWTHFAQLDAASLTRGKSYIRIRRWITVLGVLATLFAILTETYPGNFPILGSLALKILLIASPVLASVIAAFASKTYSGGDWLIKRAGAEEILKEVYLFRTILKKQADRRAYLEKRLVEIQRQIYRGLGGELVLKPFKGTIPPYYSQDDPNSDPGFNDLTGDEYFRYRLESQLAWHIKEVNKDEVERTRLYWYILVAGGLGSVFAALGGPFSLWVALTASFTAAFIGWQELRNLDAKVRNYSKVIMELGILYDHWGHLELEERTDSEFYNMVRSTEEILWNQNVEYIKSMQEALTDASLEKEASLVNRVIKESVEADARFKQSLRDSLGEFASETITNTERTLTESFQKALGTLAEEASSELVQAELAAMGQTISDAVQSVAQAAGFADKLKEIMNEFAGVEIGRDTPTSVLNDLMSRCPKSSEVKG